MAQPSKTRYFKGKAPEALADSDSDSDEEDDRKPVVAEASKIDKNIVAGGAGRVITDVSTIRQKIVPGAVKMELGSAKIGTGKPPVKAGVSGILYIA
jgi:microfibrillar-associated protein 1